MMFQINLVSIVTNLLFLIVIPLFTGQIIRKSFPQKTKTLTSKNEIVQLVLLVLLLWGAVAPGAVYAITELRLFAAFNIFIFCILGLTFIFTYIMGRRLVTANCRVERFSTHKNATLAIVIGTCFFDTKLTPLIANLVAQKSYLYPTGQP